MSGTTEAFDGLAASLEHTESAQDLASELKDIHIEVMGCGGVAQSQLEIAIGGIPYYTQQVKSASESGSKAFNDSERTIQILTHSKALSREMRTVWDHLAKNLSGKVFYANYYREAALRCIDIPLNSLEAALSSFDLFTSKLNDATHVAETISTKIGDAKTIAIEAIPKSTGLVDITSYLTCIKEAERVQGNQRGLLVAAENHIPCTGQQLIIGIIDGLKTSLGLLEQAKDKNIENLAGLLEQANAEVTPEIVPELKGLVESIKKSVDMIQRSKNETVQFQETTQLALEDGRKILGLYL